MKYYYKYCAVLALFDVILDRVKETSVKYLNFYIKKKEKTKVFWKSVDSVAIQVCAFQKSLIVNSL